jgi:methionine-rich copper-binding protein CopC
MSALFRTVALAAATLTLSATAALAHPHLLSSAPAAKATVAPTSTLVLHFSETLEPKFSGADVSSSMTMTVDGKPMTHEMKIGGATSAVDPKDKKSVIVTLKSPLLAGAYTVAWHAVSTDTHRLTGTYSFTVK